MPDTDRLAALLREAWDGWDGENPQPDDPHEWQAVCLRAAGVTLAAPTCCDLACYEDAGCECDGCKAPAPAEGLEPLDGVDCDWDENGKCRCKPAAPAEGLGECGFDALLAGHRTEEAHDCFAMNCKALGHEVAALRAALLQPAAPAEGLDVELLARAIRTAEVRSQMGAQRMGAVPPDDGPLPDWYRAYAEDVAREYAALKRRPTDD